MGYLYDTSNWNEVLGLLGSIIYRVEDQGKVVRLLLVCRPE